MPNLHPSSTQPKLTWPNLMRFSLPLPQWKSVQFSLWIVGTAMAWWWVQRPVVAQSIVEANDGTGTVVQQQGDRHRISGGSISADGHNLFHSFEEFGLESREMAEFLAQPNIDNILGRVVGGDISVIDGLLQVSGGNANLFLINPAGIILGPNARLDVPASFTATTATGIGFGNQWFHAFGENDYSTLVGNPDQFAFATDQPGSLLNEATLDVSSGHRIMLLGGSVIHTGTLTAPNGTITIAAVPEQQVVRLSQEGMLLNLEFEAIADTNLANRLNPLPFTPLSLPELLVGGDRQHHANHIEVAADGSIHLVQTNTTLAPSTENIALVSGDLDVGSPDSSHAGSISVVGDRVALLDATVTADGMNYGGTIRIGGDYRGSATLPTATQTVVNEGSRLSADAIANGNGGEIIVWSDQSTEVFGEITATGGANGGDGGFVEVSGYSLNFDSSQIDLTARQGTMGTLLIDPLDITIVDEVGANDGAIIGDGTLFGNEGTGIFTISAEQLQTLSGNTNIRLEAQRDITINNLASDALQFAPGTGSITFIADADQSNGGNFSMHESDRLITNGRDLEISAVDISLGAVEAAGGDIRLNSRGTLTVANDLTSSTFLGTGGDVIATATGSITLGQDPLFESVQVTGADSSGSIRLTSETGEIAIAGGLNTSAISGTAGDITLDAAGDIRLGANLFQTSLDSFGLEGGGDIRVISRNGNVDASAGSLGSIATNGVAGNITVEAAGNIRVGTDGFGDGIYSSGENQRSGDIRLISQGGSVAIAGELDSVSETGVGGNILVQAEGNITLGSDAADPEAQGFAVNSSGGEASGSIQIISTLGTIDSRQGSLQTVTDSGSAGLVELTALGDIILGTDSDGVAIATEGPQQGGAIALTSQTGQIDIGQGALSSTAIGGTAGDIRLDAFGNIRLGDDGDGVAIAAIGTNRGGNISLTSRAGEIQAEQGLLATASSAGTAGQVSITAQQSVNLGEIVAAGNTAGGDVQITSQFGNVAMGNGSISSMAETGAAGDVIIAAQGEVTIGNGNPVATLNQLDLFPGGLTGGLADDGSGSIQAQGLTQGGTVQITSGVGGIAIDGGVDSFSDAGIGGSVVLEALGEVSVGDRITTTGLQQGGNITLITTTAGLNLQNTALESFSNTGTAGSIHLSANENVTTGRVAVYGGQQGGNLTITSTRGGITATEILNTESASGAAGNVNLTARETVQTQTISATGLTRGGNINITSTNGAFDSSNSPLRAFSDEGTAGNITITTAQDVVTGAINTQGLQRGGDITITSDRTISTTSLTSQSAQGTAGNIRLTAQDNLQVTEINAAGDQQGGEIVLTSEADVVTVEDAIDSLSLRGLGGDVTITAEGTVTSGDILTHGLQQGGDVRITSGDRIALPTATINTSSAMGTAGDVNLNAEGTIQLGGNTTTSAIWAAGQAQGGQINLTSQQNRVTVAGDLNSFSINGTAGDVSIQAQTQIQLAQSIRAAGAQQGGDITLRTATAGLDLNDVALITASSQGRAGEVTLEAEASITTGAVEAAGTQRGGDITITSRAGGITANQTLNSHSSEGTAGRVTLNAATGITTTDILASGLTQGGNISLDGGDGAIATTGLLNSFSAQDTAGRVTLTTTGEVSLLGIAAQGLQQGGDITVISTTAGITVDGRLVSFSDQGVAGAVMLNAVDNITLRNADPAIRTVGFRQGGDITITSTAGGFTSEGRLVTLSPQGVAGTVRITTRDDIEVADGDRKHSIRSRGEAQGGDIILTSSAGEIRTVGALVSASSEGNAGDVTLMANGDITLEGHIDEAWAVRSRGEAAGGNITITSALGGIDINGRLVSLSPNGNAGDVNLVSHEIIDLPDIEERWAIRAQGLEQDGDVSLLSRDSTFTGSEGDIPPHLVSSVTGEVKEGQRTPEPTPTSTEPTPTSTEPAPTSPPPPPTPPTSVGGAVMANTQAAIATLEGQREHEFSTYFGRDLTVETMTPASIQDILANVQAQTGNTSAIVYITAPSAPADRLRQHTGKTDGASPLIEHPLELLLFTPDAAPIRITVPDVGREQLFNTVTEFRNQLVLSERRGNHHYLPTAQRLHNWLIAPLEAKLGPDAVDTLLFSMDSGLRGLPIAALHDGEQFLVEKYSMGMVPSVGLMDTQYHPLGQADVLAMGADTFIQQNPLPAVPIEVGTITQIRNGTAFLNEAFTQANLTEQRQQTPYRIIHLATHAAFNPGTADQSYIQLWGDERLDLSEVQTLGWNNPAVDLLVLSACQTAVGNTEAELGFAGLAVASGVRSAVASLWTVSDGGTLALMTAFYDHLNQAEIKSEALRQSQLALLHGQTRIEDGQLVQESSQGPMVLPSEVVQWGDRDLSHPYYWSGFTMIGSPW